MRTRSRPVATLVACVQLCGLWLACSPGWFGHIRYATPLVHADDHRDLAAQALRHLVRERLIAGRSRLARRSAEIASACGMLDRDESEMSRTPGRLRWEYSHMYDPIARRGIDDRRDPNALVEFEDFWQRALLHQRIGNEARAAKFLGYCCHLLQDMAVPAHTHCIDHGLRPRIADNLELVASSRRFRLREPAGAPYRGEDGMHLSLFIAMGIESRGFDSEGDGPNELAETLAGYYGEPLWTSGGWRGAYRGESYYPCHRLLPSSPRIKLVHLVTLRNFLMARAAERTAQLLLHFSDLTGAGEAV